jgi:hypothetical protein
MTQFNTHPCRITSLKVEVCVPHLITLRLLEGKDSKLVVTITSDEIGMEVGLTPR